MPEKEEGTPSLPELDSPQSDLIPATVAVNENARDYASEVTVFSFVDYNPKECGLHNCDKKNAKALTAKLSLLSKITLRELVKAYFKQKVEPGGEYAGLYAGLGEDVVLHEIEYTGQGRIFGYVYENQFRVVAFDKIRHK